MTWEAATRKQEPKQIKNSSYLGVLGYLDLGWIEPLKTFEFLGGHFSPNLNKPNKNLTKSKCCLL